MAKHDATGRTPAQCAEILRIVGDGTRLQLLRALYAAPRCVSELCESLQLAPHFVSRHLAVLRHSELVTAERVGRRRIYSLHPNVRSELLDDGTLELGCCAIRLLPQASD